MASGLEQAFAIFTGLALGQSSANAKAEAEKAEKEAKEQAKRDAFNRSLQGRSFLKSVAEGKLDDARATGETLRKLGLDKKFIDAKLAQAETIQKQQQFQDQRFKGLVKQNPLASKMLFPETTGLPTPPDERQVPLETARPALGTGGIAPIPGAPVGGTRIPAIPGARPGGVPGQIQPIPGAKPQPRATPRAVTPQTRTSPTEVTGPAIKMDDGQTVETLIDPINNTIKLRFKEIGTTSETVFNDAGQGFNIIKNEHTGKIVDIEKIEGFRASNKERERVMDLLDALGVIVSPQSIEYGRTALGMGAGKGNEPFKRIFMESLEQLGRLTREQKGLPSRGIPVFAEAFKQVEQRRLNIEAIPALIKQFDSDKYFKFSNTPVLIQQFDDLINITAKFAATFAGRPIAAGVRTAILKSGVFRTILDGIGDNQQAGSGLPSRQEFVSSISGLLSKPTADDNERIAQIHTLLVDLRQFTSDPRLSNADANRVITGLTSNFSTPEFAVRQLLSTRRQIVRRFNQDLKTARAVTRLDSPLELTDIIERRFEDVIKAKAGEFTERTVNPDGTVTYTFE